MLRVYWIIFILSHFLSHILSHIFCHSFYFFAIFDRNVFSALYAKNFEKKLWKNILWNWWVDCFLARSIKWCDVLSGHSESFSSFIQYFFSLQKTVFLSASLSLAYCWINQFRCFWQTQCDDFLENSSSSWIILSFSLDELNSSDWLWKRWWWIFLKQLLFYGCKRIFIWQKILDVFWRI